jgi:phosphopantetheinyl transferase
LLCEGLQKEYGITEQPLFEYGPHGKPFIVGHPDIHFNLSHCREAAICIVDAHPVGIDIESVRMPKDSLVRYTMNEAEQQQIFTSPTPALAFTRLWTMKEAAVKRSGHGLQNDFGSYYGDISATFEKYSGSTRVPSAKSLYLWDAGDERYAGTFMTTFYNTADVWGTEGYYAYYNATDAQKANLPIAWLYAPYYTDKAAFEAQLTAMKDRFKAGLANVPHAYIMGSTVTAYKFDAEGNWSEDAAVSGTYNDATLQNRLNFTPSVKKWDDPQTPQSNMNTTEDYRDIVVLHASDLYLVAAEAYMLMKENGKCIAKINDVRNRAHAAPITTLAAYDPGYTHGTLQMVDLVLDERARELYAEGQRFMDLRRTHQLVKYNVAYNNYITSVAEMSNGAGEIKWYRPIPTTELSSNTSPDMKQNPGY